MSAAKIGSADRFLQLSSFFEPRRPAVREAELTIPLANLDQTPRAPDALRLKLQEPRSAEELRAAIDRFLTHALDESSPPEIRALHDLLQNQRQLVGHYFGQ